MFSIENRSKFSCHCSYFLKREKGKLVLKAELKEGVGGIKV